MLFEGIKVLDLSTHFLIDNKHPDAAIDRIRNVNAPATFPRVCFLSAHKFTVEGTQQFHEALQSAESNVKVRVDGRGSVLTTTLTPPFCLSSNRTSYPGKRPIEHCNVNSGLLRCGGLINVTLRMAL